MRIALFVLVAGVAACSPNRMFQRGPQPDPNVEALFARSLGLLETSRPVAALDTAATLLDAYLAHAGYVARRSEARALRRLTGEAIQLSRVAAALQQERADNRTKTSESSAPAQRSDNDSLKEIQRLKDELAEANAELERIKKRLATQKP